MGAQGPFGAQSLLRCGLLGSSLALILLAPAVAANPGQILESRGSMARDEDPVILSGSSFPDFFGSPIADLALFRYDDSSGSFVPIPFQFDERKAYTFNEGTPLQFTEILYDIMHEDNGLLDADDELALLFGDAGNRAPVNLAWPMGSELIRYEIGIQDPRPSAPHPQKWVYLFAGAGLPRSETQYVTWNQNPAGTIASDRFSLDYDDRWLLTGFHIFPPCGTGADVIDRVKGRAVPNLVMEEDEEGWNSNSLYLGGLTGPVRAIRYVRGATSGVNTIHHDIIYRSFWKRAVNLRVHPITECRLYVDWRFPGAGARMFTPLVRTGVKMDGVPDPSIGSSYIDWAVFRNPEGGLAVLFNLPPSPKYQARSFFYKDDAAYNDEVPTNPNYGDEDDAAYGVFGLRVNQVTDCNVDPILFEFRFYPLCANIGDALVGDSYEELRDYPLQTPVAPQWLQAGPVGSLRVRRDGLDVLLAWDPIGGVSGYRVYSSEFPDLPPSSWTKMAEPTNPRYRDVAASGNPVPRFYSITGFNPAGEGGW